MSLTIGTEYATYAYQAKETTGANEKSSLSVYDQKVLDEYEAELAARRNEKIKAGEAAINKAQVYGYNEFNLNMETDANGKKTGMVVIVINEDMRPSEIRSKLGIAPNKLREHNKAVFDKLETTEFGDRGVQTHEFTDIPKNTRFVIPGTDINPQKPLLQKIGDWWNNLTK